MIHKGFICCVVLCCTVFLPSTALSGETDAEVEAEAKAMLRSVIDGLHEKRGTLEPEDMLRVDTFLFSLKDPEFLKLIETEDLAKIEQLVPEVERKKSLFSTEEREQYEEGLDFLLARYIEDELDAMTEEEVAALDQRLQNDWHAMLDALARDDIETAISYFHKKTRDSYRRTFEAIPKEHLATLANGMRRIHFDYHRSFGMIYDLRKTRDGQEYSFQMSFVKEVRGDWKIHGF